MEGQDLSDITNTKSELRNGTMKQSDNKSSERRYKQASLSKTPGNP